MDTYVTGGTIRRLREKNGMTQLALADRLCVSDKAVSRWETGRGYPDITMLESLAGALGVSVSELLSGSEITNKNRSANLLRSKWYVCPVCGNILHATGEASVSCCGIALPPLEAEPADGEHAIRMERIEDETFITLDHPMTKEHYISFLVYVTDGSMQYVKLYPEGNAEARFRIRGRGKLYAFCNRHGLFEVSYPQKAPQR